jgi:hypothetical protein
MTTPRTIECALPAGRRRSRRPDPPTCTAVASGRGPLVSRLLAFGPALDRLVRSGEIAAYATLARPRGADRHENRESKTGLAEVF